MSGDARRLGLRIIGMSCASCAKIIRKELGKNGGIRDVKVNPILNAVYVDNQPEKISEEEIEEAVKKSGYEAVRLKGMKGRTVMPKGKGQSDSR